MTLSTLRARLETATESVQAEVLEMAFYHFIVDKYGDYENWRHLQERWFKLMDAQAYESAALLIMREVLPGCIWRLGHDVEGPDPSDFRCSLAVGDMPIFYHATHSPESLAIIAAVCAAKADSDPTR